jgi:hypothetical protein
MVPANPPPPSWRWLDQTGSNARHDLEPVTVEFYVCANYSTFLSGWCVTGAPKPPFVRPLAATASAPPLLVSQLILRRRTMTNLLVCSYCASCLGRRCAAMKTSVTPRPHYWRQGLSQVMLRSRVSRPIAHARRRGWLAFEPIRAESALGIRALGKFHPKSRALVQA